ncbi:Gfo/Idh/MocA family protein [Silvimonas amylolytica]|uniref:Dehydrogenase n=1 Tax=Silvimonas amylolytica TaxID=449663 RepID=A0ABQ2PGR2_9NEIS|nr:Gfo/Idh/MocA family oxidoreductase [Silvimonas amylolytica]GGP24799.1 dehydrogenase [Silvimonas amylolytica]
MNKALGIAIIGTGMIGAVHRRAAALSGGVLRGVVASSLERSRVVAQQWQCEAYADADAVFADKAIDVVHICTPNATHHDLARRALLAGKHVICEKPLATSLADATELATLARDSGLVTAVPFVYRYHPMVREARARIANGELGALNLIHGNYLQDWLLGANDTNWRVDAVKGGASRAFADIGSHWCDLMEWVTGERFVETVSSLRTVLAERPAATRATFSGSADANDAKMAVTTEDIAGALLRTDKGTLATLTISQVSAGRKNHLWFEIDGMNESLTFNQEEPERLWVGQRDAMQLFVKDPSQGSAEQRRLATLPAGHAQGYADCFEAFVADTYSQIRGEPREGLPTFADGARSAQIVDAILASAKQRAWTSIPV